MRVDTDAKPYATRRRGVVGLLSAASLCLAFLCGPTAAFGGTASVTAGQLSYVAAPGEANDVTVSFANGAYIVRDDGAPVSAASGCTSVTANTARCLNITFIVIAVHDRSDAVRNYTATDSRISGGDGDDVLVALSGTDRIDGDAGNDQIDPGVGTDTASGGPGDDTITSRGAHRDIYLCGPGIDSVVADALDTVAADCEFVDRPGGASRGPQRQPGLGFLPRLGNAACQISRVGTLGDDTIIGTPRGDNLFGLAGNDTLDGAGADDCLFGGEGVDRLTGGTGSDRLHGDRGGDIMRGAAGSDGLLGGSGNDAINGGSGRDGALGGSGRDRLRGAGGGDQLSGGSGNDRLSGGSGGDRLFGDSGNDRIVAGSGRNRLSGGAGRDVLDSRNGRRDSVNCGSGRDRARADRVDRVRRCERTVRTPGRN